MAAVEPVAGGLSKNNKSPPPHSGCRLNEIILISDVVIMIIIIHLL